MENKALIFEQKHMMAFLELRNLQKSIDAAEDRMKEIRETLLKGMEENGIKSIDNEYVTISHVNGTPGKPKLDEKAWRAEDPEGYNKVFQKYNKMAGARRASVRIVTK